MELDKNGNYCPWQQPLYGKDARGNDVVLPEGYVLVARNSRLEQGCIPYDVYSGWLDAGFFNPKYHYGANSEGRWTAWAMPNLKPRNGMTTDG